MINKLIIGLFAVLALLLSPSFVAAEDSSVQKAVEGVREKVGTLAASKDEGETETLELRIETLKKVVDLSLAEAKDLKLKLLALDIKEEDEALIAWQDSMVLALNRAIAFYEAEKNSLIERDIASIADVKKIAEDFRAWREANYVSVTQEINEFFLIEQEDRAIKTAEARAKKIGNDLQKLSKVRGIDALMPLFEKAEEFIKEAAKLNSEARELFEISYLKQYEKEVELRSGLEFEGSTSSVSNTISPTPVGANILNSTSTATSSAPNVDSEAGEANSDPSIKDLVRSSLTKVKDAYQVFIEMSGFVRKLLN